MQKILELVRLLVRLLVIESFPFTNGLNILCLSGGGAYGSFELGVVSKMIEDGKGKWDLVTGVSAGSINALYLGTILPEDEHDIPVLKTLWENTKSKDIYSYEFFMNGLSFYKTDALKKTITNIFANRKLVRPIIISATSMNRGNKQLFTNTDIELYGFVDPIMASTAIPIVFPPYKWSNDVYVDGGLSSNILIEDAIEWAYNQKKDTESIVIDVVICGKQNSYEQFILNTKNYVERLISIIEEQVEYHELFDTIAYNYNLTINLYEQKEKGGISLVDFDQGALLFEQGHSGENVDIHVFRYSY